MGSGSVSQNSAFNRSMEITQIEHLLVSSLIPYARNSRTHSDEQVAQIAASIREFGFTNPVLIDANGTIIAGHGRVMAAKKLGLDEVPCLRLGHLTPSQIRAYVIADNKIALNAGWDDEMLKAELLTLQEDGFNTDLTGFSDEELNALLTVETVEGETDPDEVPEAPVEPITKLGDIWILGNHRLMCGDSTSIDSIEKLMNGLNADFCFTSPPYNAGTSERLSGNTHTTDNKYGMYKDDKDQSEYLNLLNEFCSSWLLFCNCVCVNIQQLAGNKIAFINWIYNQKDRFVDVAIWDKGHGAPQMAKNVMSNRFEFLIFLSKEIMPSRAIPCSNFQGTVQNVYSAPPQRSNEFSNVHAATFPVHLPLWAIETFTKPNSIISDAFGGTGTTLIDCEKTGRKARLMELDPKYCDVIVKRWEDFTGKKAVLEKPESND